MLLFSQNGQSPHDSEISDPIYSVPAEQLTLQRGMTSTARHSENITYRGMTSTARHAARSHSFVYILTT